MAFEQTFACGQSALLRRFKQDCRYSCKGSAPSPCQAVCQDTRLELKREIAECSATEATLVDGDGAIRTVTSDEFAALRGNLVRAELAGLDTYLDMAGQVRLTGLAPVQYLPRRGDEIPAWELSGEFAPVGSESVVDFSYTVSREVSGAAQILLFKVMGSRIYRVLELNPQGSGP